MNGLGNVAHRLSSLCRLCLVPGVGMEPIFNPNDNSFLLKIVDIVGLELHECDGLPSHICQQCCFQLISANNFKQRCILSEQTLRAQILQARAALGIRPCIPYSSHTADEHIVAACVDEVPIKVDSFWEDCPGEDPLLTERVHEQEIKIEPAEPMHVHQNSTKELFDPERTPAEGSNVAVNSNETTIKTTDNRSDCGHDEEPASNEDEPLVIACNFGESRASIVLGRMTSESERLKLEDQLFEKVPVVKLNLKRLPSEGAASAAIVASKTASDISWAGDSSNDSWNSSTGLDDCGSDWSVKHVKRYSRKKLKKRSTFGDTSNDSCKSSIGLDDGGSNLSVKHVKRHSRKKLKKQSTFSDTSNDSCKSSIGLDDGGSNLSVKHVKRYSRKKLKKRSTSRDTSNDSCNSSTGLDDGGSDWSVKHVKCHSRKKLKRRSTSIKKTRTNLRNVTFLGSKANLAPCIKSRLTSKRQNFNTLSSKFNPDQRNKSKFTSKNLKTNARSSKFNPDQCIKSKSTAKNLKTNARSSKLNPDQCTQSRSTSKNLKTNARSSEFYPDQCTQSKSTSKNLITNARSSKFNPDQCTQSRSTSKNLKTNAPSSNFNPDQCTQSRSTSKNLKTNARSSNFNPDQCTQSRSTSKNLKTNARSSKFNPDQCTQSRSTSKNLKTNSRSSKFNPDQCIKSKSTVKDLRNNTLIGKETGVTVDVLESSSRKKCAVCLESFESTTSLGLHDIEHRELLTCCACDKKFRLLWNFKRHTHCHVAKKNFVCMRCPKQFLSMLSLVEHGNVHNLESTIEGQVCYVCHHSFLDLKSLLFHYRLKHIGRSDRSYVCYECGKACDMAPELVKHYLSDHNTVWPFPCTSCDRTFHTHKGLHIHLASHKRLNL